MNGAVAAVENGARDPSVQLEAQAQSLTGKEIGKGTALYRDMHLLVEGGGTHPQCPHLLINDARWLTLRRMKRAGTLQSQGV